MSAGVPVDSGPDGLAGRSISVLEPLTGSGRMMDGLEVAETPRASH